MRLRKQNTLKGARKRMNKLPGFGPCRTRAGAGAADLTRGRRNRADAAADAASGLGPDRERTLSLAAAAEPRRRRGAARSLHADAGRDRQGRCLDRLVPWPMRVCAMTAAYLDPETGAARFSTPPPGILAWGAIAQRGAGRARRLHARNARWNFASGSVRRAGSARMSRSSKPTATCG